MPPFREGSIKVDRRFDGDALREVREIGHGRRINIVDASYPIPRGAFTVKFPGSSAEALLGIVRLIPIEGDVEIMERDAEIQKSSPGNGHVSAEASHAFNEIAHTARQEGIDLALSYRYRNGEEGSEGIGGFYDNADNAPDSLYIRTIDELPFACASLTAGHSQRTA